MMCDNVKNLEKLGNRINNIYNIINNIYNETPGLFASNSIEYFKEGPCFDFTETCDPNIIILRSYYNAPHYIQTYWGEITLMGSSGSTPQNDKILWEKLHSIFGLIKIKDKQITELGEYGPWYQITKINERDIINLKISNFDSIYKYKNNIKTLTYKEKKDEFKKYVY